MRDEHARGVPTRAFSTAPVQRCDAPAEHPAAASGCRPT